MTSNKQSPELERAGSGGSQTSALNEADFVRKVSRHQSSHFYQSIEQIRNFETREDKCKNVVLDYLSKFEHLIKDDENTDDVLQDILQTIFDKVDIPPLNRKSKFDPSFNNYKDLLNYIEKSEPILQNNNNNTDNKENNDNELSDAQLADVNKRIIFKWTIGETENNLFPRISETTLQGIYFAEIQSQIVRKYQIVGSIRDPQFTKLCNKIKKTKTKKQKKK